MFLTQQKCSQSTFEESQKNTHKQTNPCIHLLRQSPQNCLPDACPPQRLKKHYVVLNSFHTFSSRDSSAIQPRRKERSSAQFPFPNGHRFSYFGKILFSSRFGYVFHKKWCFISAPEPQPPCRRVYWKEGSGDVN